MDRYIDSFLGCELNCEHKSNPTLLISPKEWVIGPSHVILSV